MPNYLDDFLCEVTCEEFYSEEDWNEEEEYRRPQERYETFW